MVGLLGSLNTVGISLQDLADVCRSVPIGASQPGEGFTDRVWFKAVIKELHELVYIDCPDVDLLELELSALQDGVQTDARMPSHWISGCSS